MTTANNTVCNIASRLTLMAGRYPEKAAVKMPIGKQADGNPQYRTLSFAELDAEVDALAHGLTGLGVSRGMRTVLMVKPSVGFFALTFALMRIGAVPVMIDPGMGRRRMVDCLREIEPEAFIGIPLAHVFRLLYRSAFASVRHLVTVGPRLGWGGVSYSQLIAKPPHDGFDCAATSPNDPAAILFTTGSTGPPKGVLYEHRHFAAQVDYLESHYGYSPEEIDLPTFPLFALFDAALGMTAVIPVMDFTKPGEVDPRAILGPIEREGVTHTFGSPALLDRVSRYGETNNIRLPKLKRVMSAGAPVPPAVLTRYHKMLSEDAEIFTPYGATESLPVSSIGSHEILGETAALSACGRGTCVGRPLAGLTVRIIGIDDAPIAEWSDALCVAEGTIGEIVVKGPVVTTEYYRKPKHTALAKIREADEVWHRMGDLGYYDAQGRLWFCGRKAHRVTSASGDLFTVPCEAIFNQHPKVRRTALVGVGERGNQRPVLCVELEAGASTDESGLFDELRALSIQHEQARQIDTFLIHPKFPVDIRHNAKIFREKLAVWAAEQLS